MPEPLDSPANLARTLGFSAVDLAANQLGQLSQAQRDHLATSARTFGSGEQIVGVGILGLLIAGNFLLGMLRNGQGLSTVFALGALSSAGTILWGVRVCATSRTVCTHRLESVEGEIRFEEPDNDGWPTMPLFHVGDLKFHVRSDAQAVLKDGGRYRIYYTQISMLGAFGMHTSLMILSMEESPNLAGI